MKQVGRGLLYFVFFHCVDNRIIILTHLNAYIVLFVCVLRVLWAKYFDSITTKVAFFSAVEETKRLKDKVNMLFESFGHTMHMCMA